MSKKTLFVAILTGVLMITSFAHADVTSDLQAQINSLLVTIKRLQAQLDVALKATSTQASTSVVSTIPTTSSAKFCYTFTKNLTVGSTGADVRALNNVLSLENISDRVTSEIEIFDEFTAGHVVRLQTKYGINATGYFGPMTRAAINAAYACNTQVPAISPMIISDIKSVTSVNPKSTANLSFGVKEVSSQYNLGAYHGGTWYEGMNPNTSGPMWIEFGWPNSPAVDVVFLDQNNVERKVYLPAVGSNIDQNNVSHNWYYWIAEDGSGYYANTSHSYGWPNLTYKEALTEKHLARKAGTVPSFNISILTPKSGDVVNVGTPVRIDWGAFGSADNSSLYDITLFTDNGKGNIAEGVTQAQAGCLGYGKGVCSYIWTPTSASSKTQIAVSKRGTTEIGYSGSFSVVSKTNQPSITVSSPDQPSSSIAPKNAARIPFTKFTVRATDGDVVLNSFVVQKEGSAPNSVLSSIIILDEYGQPVVLPHSLSSNHQTIIGGKLTIKSGTSRTLTIAGSTASDLSASAGKTISLSLVGLNTSSVVSGQLPITGASHVVNNTLNIGTLSYTRVNKSVTNSNTTYDLSFTAGSAESVRLKSFVLQNISWYGSITVNETGATYYCSRTLLDTAYCDFGAGILIGKGLTVSLSSSRVGGFVVIPQVDDINAIGEVYGYGIVPVYGSVSVNSSPKIVGFPVVPASVQPGQMVNFNFTAKDSDNDDLAWSFEFGDGSGVADACSVGRPRSGKGANMTIGHVWNNAGIYQFSAKVYDCQGGSDSYKFFVNVGSATNNLPPVINGVDAPTTLSVGQTGTWTVRASDPENGNLSYSVIWGDEQNYIAMNAGSVSSAPFVQSTTFTHSYATAGTYNVSFSVRDNAGQISRTSATVRVVNTNQPSITVLSPNGGEVWLAGSNQTIKWTSNNIPSAQVLIQYFKNTSSVYDFYVPNTGSAQITVPANIGTGNDFSIVVGYKNNTGVFYNDSSDSPFTINLEGVTNGTIRSFTATKLDSDGWYYKLSWTTAGTNQVQLTQYPGVGGASFTSDTGQNLSVTTTFPSPGSVNVRLTNGYSYPAKASFILDPLPLNFYQVESYRKTITIDVPANETNPVALSVSPVSATVGSGVTIYGKQFLLTGNTVALVKEPNGPEFDINNLSSVDGKSLSFKIPNSTVVTGEDGIVRTVDVTPGQYYLVVNNTNGKSGVLRGFSVTGFSTQPTITSISLQNTFDDKSGAWDTFKPGTGRGNLNGADWNFISTINFPTAGKQIKRITISHNTSGEVWSTGNSRYLSDGTDLYGYNNSPYPIVVLYSGKQLNSQYNDANLSAQVMPAGSQNLYLYAQPESGRFTGGKLIVEFTDNTSVNAVISASSLTQPVVRKYTDDEILMYLEQAARNRTKGPFSPATEIDFDMNNDRLVNATDQILIRSIKTIPDEKFDIAYKRIVKIIDSQIGKIKTDSGFIDELDVDRNGVISVQDKADILRVITGNRVYPPLVQYPITFSNSPIVQEQNIAVGVPNQILGGFEVNNTANESVKINRIAFSVKVLGIGGLAEEITNVSLFDSVGNVVAGPVDTRTSDSIISFDDTFIAPIGKSTFYIKGRLGSRFVSGQTVYLYLPEIGFPKGVTTDKDYVLPVQNFTLSRMTARTASLSVSAGNTPVAQNITAGSQGVIFTNFQFDATQSSEDVRITSIPVHLTYTSGAGNDVSACQLYDGSVAITTGVNVVNPGVTPSSASYKFNLDQPVTVAKGSTKSLAVKCNVASSATSFAGHFDMTTSDVASVSAYATVSGGSVVPAGSAIGNTMTVSGSEVVAMTDAEIISSLEATIRKYPCTFVTFSQGTCKLNFDLGSDNRVDLSDEITMRNVLTLSDTQFDTVYKKIIAEVDSRVGSVTGSVNFEAGFDVNRDGTINANDKASIIKAIVGNRVYTPSI